MEFNWLWHLGGFFSLLLLLGVIFGAAMMVACRGKSIHCGQCGRREEAPPAGGPLSPGAS